MKYQDDYRKLHEQKAFAGMTLAKFADPVAKSLRWIDAKSVLDYGSGSGVSWERSPKLAEAKKRLKTLAMYDPGIPGKDELPQGKFDAVLCFDVLEHVPEEEVPETLKNIFERAERLVVMSFCPRGSKKKLPSTGQDVHVTQKPREWWERQISSVNLSHGKPTLWFLHENP